jgi:CBS-domain-containing membrane protein
MSTAGPGEGVIDPDRITIGEFNVMDEFLTVEKGISCQELAKRLLEMPRGAVFLLNEQNVPVGAVTARELLLATVRGADLLTLKGEDVMNTKIMEVSLDDKLSEVFPKITTFAPYAVIVKDRDGKFVGYFSPKDYHEALQKAGVL